MKRQSIATYEEAVEYLLNIPRFTKKNTMEDTRAFLQRLGNPEKAFRIIHVAGTNGKGSVCAYLRYMLEEAGYKVASFTSPHLVDIRERFLIQGKMVSRERFFAAFQTIYDMIPWKDAENAQMRDDGRPGFYHPTYFEYLFFIGMLLFQEEKPDIVILETGLGGRLDATNSVSNKDLTVITRISLDHVEYLGDTPEKIAAEKAGIMMKGVPLVYLDTENKVNAVFENRAAKLGILARKVSKENYVFQNLKNKNIDFSLHTRYYKDIRVILRTCALYQMENAALAVAALEEFDHGTTVTVKQIINGLKRCFWPARMEEILPGVFVDGAHNEDGIRAFLESVSASDRDGQRIILFSAVRDKAYPAMLERIVSSKLFAGIYVVPMKTGRATEITALEELIRESIAKNYVDVSAGPKTGSFKDVPDALKYLMKNKKNDQEFYIAGSLYLAGEVKEYLGVFEHDQF